MSADAQTVRDEDLARQAQGGSLSAFEELVFRYEGRIYRFVANICPAEADAREVTQETFIRAFQALKRFDPHRAFAPWLFTIARRKCVDFYRSAPRQLPEPVPELADPNSPAELLSREEEQARIWNLAQTCLSESQFQALWLRYAEEMDLGQIATVLRKSRGHVKVLLFRARRALGEALTRKPVAPPALSLRQRDTHRLSTHVFHEKLAAKPR